MQQIRRMSAYGILELDSKILLIRKKSGPYQGLWDLPGGGIEFGETPQEALKRELLEESAFSVHDFEVSDIVTTIGQCDDCSPPYAYHLTGIIYNILSGSKRTDLIPEEENLWMTKENLLAHELTPFAKHAVFSQTQNKSWRPKKQIRGKVIGLAKHKHRLLVCEVLNDDGTLKGWCPLGGGIEFGEASTDALKRECLEELGCTVQILQEPTVWENIFEHHGAQGHEIIFAFPIHLDKPEIYTTDRFQIFEANGSAHWVEWIEIDRFKKGEFRLFPNTLIEKIDSL